MLFVRLWCEILRCWNTVTFDPFTLPSLPVDRRVMLSTVNRNDNVSFPLNGVVVNIHPPLSLSASSGGNRLDPTCAKNRKERKRLLLTDESSAFHSEIKNQVCMFTVVAFFWKT